MSKVFYHWGLEERVRKLCFKSNMVLFNRCESSYYYFSILPNVWPGGSKLHEPSFHPFDFCFQPIIRLLIDHFHHSRALTTPQQSNLARTLVDTSGLMNSYEKLAETSCSQE